MTSTTRAERDIALHKLAARAQSAPAQTSPPYHVTGCGGPVLEDATVGAWVCERCGRGGEVVTVNGIAARVVPGRKARG